MNKYGAGVMIYEVYILYIQYYEITAHYKYYIQYDDSYSMKLELGEVS